MRRQSMPIHSLVTITMRTSVFLTCFVLSSVSYGSCWLYLPRIVNSDYMFTHAEEKHTHTQYRYGFCNRASNVLYAHIHVDSMALLGKLIVRGWLDIKRIPNCIILRAESYLKDLFVSTAYNFQICIPRLTYCHSHKRYRYYYYEWFIPYEYAGGMEWDVYFYGSPNLVW